MQRESVYINGYDGRPSADLQNEKSIVIEVDAAATQHSSDVLVRHPPIINLHRTQSKNNVFHKKMTYSVSTNHVIIRG